MKYKDLIPDTDEQEHFLKNLYIRGYQLKQEKKLLKTKKQKER